MVFFLSGMLSPFGTSRSSLQSAREQSREKCACILGSPTCSAWWDGAGHRWEGNNVPNWINRVERSGDGVWRVGKQLRRVEGCWKHYPGRRGNWGALCRRQRLCLRQGGTNSPDRARCAQRCPPHPGSAARAAAAPLRPAPPLLPALSAGGATASRNAFQVGRAVFRCGLVTVTEYVTGNCWFDDRLDKRALLVFIVILNVL